MKYRPQVSVLENAAPLLVRPELNRSDSVRSYVERLVKANHVDGFLSKYFKCWDSLNKNIGPLSILSGIPRKSLLQRLTIAWRSDIREEYVRLGSSVLPGQFIVHSGRRMCWHCISAGLPPAIYWELKHYRMCHLHRFPMLEGCLACGRRYEWLGGKMCFCYRYRPHFFVPSSEHLRLARVSAHVAKSCLHSLETAPLESKNTDQIKEVLPIDALFHCMDLLQHVLAPLSFEGLKGTIPLLQKRKAVDFAIASVLDDAEYMKRLHVTAREISEDEPFILGQKMMPGQAASALRATIGGESPRLPVHPRFAELREYAKRQLLIQPR